MATINTNQREQACETCGTLLAPGQGRLVFVPDADDNDDFERIGTPSQGAYWAVYCMNSEECTARVQAYADQQRAELEIRRRNADETARAKAESTATKQASWQEVIKGLVKTGATPNGFVRTGKTFDDGQDKHQCEEISLPSGTTGWLVSWIGDSDGYYFLVPPSAAENAEAEKVRLNRVYSWWLPSAYNADSYPGPGVPIDSLTPEEVAEVQRCYAAKYAATEKEWRRLVKSAIERGDYKGAKGCEAWETLVALGADVEIVIDEVSFANFCRIYADSGRYSPEREKLTLEVTLRATLPASCYNKNGTVKAVIQRRLPSPNKNTTSNRFIRVRVEYK